jgi:hypothetical protein
MCSNQWHEADLSTVILRSPGHWQFGNGLPADWRLVSKRIGVLGLPESGSGVASSRHSA